MMSPQMGHFGLLFLLVLWSLLGPVANACQICVPLPQKTLADRLLEADAVLLAREDPDRPYHFVAIEVLKGKIGDRSIDAFLNSQARRVLAVYPQRAMVLARDRGKDRWTTLSIADAEFDRVVRLVIDHADDWTPLETANPQRLNTFAKLLGHEDPRLHELAYLEIGRAPYGTIREIAERVSVDKVRNILDDPSGLVGAGQ